MISTFNYEIYTVLDDDRGRILEVRSAFTGKKLGICNYDSIVEKYSHPDEIEDYVNSNIKFS